MNSIQKVGGYAAIVAGVQYVVILMFVFGMLVPYPGLHTDTSRLVDEDKNTIVAMANSPTPLLIQSLITALFSITLLLVALALREHLQNGAPNRMRIAVIVASVTSALGLASCMIAVTGFPLIAAANDLVAFRILSHVTRGLWSASVFACGWMIFLCGWAGLSTKKLPLGLSCVLLLAGMFSIQGVFVVIFETLSLVLNVVWTFWLGYVLIKPPATLKSYKEEQVLP